MSAPNKPTSAQLDLLSTNILAEVKRRTKAQAQKRTTRVQAAILSAQGIDPETYASAASLLSGAVEGAQETAISDTSVLPNAIYCSVTGQQIGTFTLDAAAIYQASAMAQSQIQAQPSTTETQTAQSAGNHATFVRVTCSGPAPHWRSVTPETLRANRHTDPRGYFVYMTEFALRREMWRYTKKAGNHIRWRSEAEHDVWLRSKITLYASLGECDQTLLRIANELLTLLSGVMGLRKLVIPFVRPSELGSNKALQLLLALLQAFWDEYQLSPGRFRERYGLAPVPIHWRSAMAPVKNKPIDVQNNYLAAAVSEAFNEIFGTRSEANRALTHETVDTIGELRAKRRAMVVDNAAGIKAAPVSAKAQDVQDNFRLAMMLRLDASKRTAHSKE